MLAYEGYVLMMNMCMSVNMFMTASMHVCVCV